MAASQSAVWVEKGLAELLGNLTKSLPSQEYRVYQRDAVLSHWLGENHWSGLTANAEMDLKSPAAVALA